MYILVSSRIPAPPSMSSIESALPSPDTPPDRLAAARSAIARARPDVDPGSDEFGAAILLLLSRDSGFNVDRLSARSRLPREFVARCLRRLADNGWWVDGQVLCDWGAEGAAADHFWMDVRVALGELLRRTSASGGLEWAPPHEGWVKDFEYGARDTDREIYNRYRDLARYNPEPVHTPAPPVEEEPVAERPRTMDPLLRPGAGRDARPLLPPTDPRTPRQPGRPGQNGRSVPALIEAWGNADWLG